MCGIVGYCGNFNARDVILSGLEKLEYRGYDSSGISVFTEGEIVTKKYTGRLKNLVDALLENPVNGNLGIGHTRWATHGAPSDVNAHPHNNTDNTISIVHNGIIENYKEIKEFLIGQGYDFKSDTDTEVFVQLLDYNYENNLLDAVLKSVNMIRGAYAMAIISSKDPDRLIAVRKESPLVLGIGTDGNYIASDIPALLQYTKDVIYLGDSEIADIRKDGYKIMDYSGNVVHHELSHIDWDLNAASKEGYGHFMLKEIYEQPEAVRKTISSKLDSKGMIDFGDGNFTIDELKAFNKIHIVACGTAYHAGLVGKFALEKLLRIPVTINVASEFKSMDPMLDDNILVILVSQSGETADTLSALRYAKSAGAITLAITNVVGSTISREAKKVIYTWAGPEISVASTKAYTTQLIILYLLSLDFAIKLEKISLNTCREMIEELQSISKKQSELLGDFRDFETIAEYITSQPSVYYLGRALDYYSALEGSLKLKEISYVHSEALPAGELKHGSIALLDEGFPVLVIATQPELEEKIVSAIQEVKARGAVVISIAKNEFSNIHELSDYFIGLQSTIDLFMPLLSILPLQLLAYKSAVFRGNDVDKPRNLAKSVTVE